MYNKGKGYVYEEIMYMGERSWQCVLGGQKTSH